MKRLPVISVFIIIILLSGCKKSEVVEETDCNDPNEYHKTCLKYTYSIENLTTGNNSVYEINDTILGKLHVDTGSSYYKIGQAVLVFGNEKTAEHDRIGIVGGSDTSEDSIKQILDFSFERVLHKVFFKDNLNADGSATNFSLIFEYRIAHSEQDFNSIYNGIPGWYEDEISLETVTISAEKDYSWGTEKNQTIYDNREAIAEIMARNMVPDNNENYNKTDYIAIIVNFYHPETGFAIGTDLFDNTNANTFQFRWSTGGFQFYNATEKDVYDLRQIIGE